VLLVVNHPVKPFIDAPPTKVPQARTASTATIVTPVATTPETARRRMCPEPMRTGPRVCRLEIMLGTSLTRRSDDALAREPGVPRATTGGDVDGMAPAGGLGPPFSCPSSNPHIAAAVA
jgi:hypothetical protein